MLAFYNTDDGWTEWKGQRMLQLDDGQFYQLPFDIEQNWSEQDLAQYALKPVRVTVPPPGMREVDYSITGGPDGYPLKVGVFEAIPPPSPPSSCTRAQAEMALYTEGLYEQYEELIQNHPYPPVRIWAKGAAVWQRSHPYVAAMAAEMVPPLDEFQIDALFVLANTFEG